MPCVWILLELYTGGDIMLLYDAVKYLNIEERQEIIDLVSRCREIDLILTNDPNCDKVSLLKERRVLRKRASQILSRIEALRIGLEINEKEANNDGESISSKGKRKSLGLFGRRKKKGVD